MPKLIRKRGFFDLLGFDFMVCKNPQREEKLKLLEVNTNPALSLGTRRLLFIFYSILLTFKLFWKAQNMIE